MKAIVLLGDAQTGKTRTLNILAKLLMKETYHGVKKVDSIPKEAPNPIYKDADYIFHGAGVIVCITTRGDNDTEIKKNLDPKIKDFVEELDKENHKDSFSALIDAEDFYRWDVARDNIIWITAAQNLKLYHLVENLVAKETSRGKSLVEPIDKNVLQYHTENKSKEFDEACMALNTLDARRIIEVLEKLIR